MAGYTQFQIEGLAAPVAATGLHRMFLVFDILAPILGPALTITLLLSMLKLLTGEA